VTAIVVEQNAAAALEQSPGKGARLD